LKTSVDRLEPTKVKLTVEVEPADVAKAFAAAARELAQEVNIPGFRKGKVPRRLIEARFGADVIAHRAQERAVPGYVVAALRAESLDPVGRPTIEVQRFSEAEGAAVEATLEVRPPIDLPDHSGIRVSFPEWDVPEGAVGEQLEYMREKFAEIDEVSRPATTGDFVTIDLVVRRDGTPIDDAAAQDALYEVGSGGVTPMLDEMLLGGTAGAILKYEDALPADYPEHGGATVEFQVLVKDVRAKKLPPLDDDFAQTASEFDTLADLEADVRAQLRRVRYGQARAEVRGRVLEAYAAGIDVPLPETLLTAERAGRVDELTNQATAYGLDLDTLLQAQGIEPDKLEQQIGTEAERAVKARLVLDALAEQEAVMVTAEEVVNHGAQYLLRRGYPREEVQRALRDRDTLAVFAVDARRAKALDVLVAAANIDGEPTEADLLDAGVLNPPTAEPGDGAILDQAAEEPATDDEEPPA